jgi:hypothetical protein
MAGVLIIYTSIQLRLMLHCKLKEYVKTYSETPDERYEVCKYNGKYIFLNNKSERPLYSSQSKSKLKTA